MEMTKINKELEVHKQLIEDQMSPETLGKLIVDNCPERNLTMLKGNKIYYKELHNETLTMIAYAEGQHGLEMRLDDELEKKQSLVSRIQTLKMSEEIKHKSGA